MASIKDFFERSYGASSAPERITHGSTYQRWTFSCCSSCCQCIPTTTDYYSYEMWGQGGGGAPAFCCQGGVDGATASGYNGIRISYLACSSNRQMCFCGCYCYCCGDTDGCCGHCGQFSRMCLCGLGHCSVQGGGCIPGGTECWYVITDNTCNDCWINEASIEHGSGASGGDISQNCNHSDSVCQFNPDPDVTIGSGGSSSGSLLDKFCLYPCSCGPWNGTGHCAYIVENSCGAGTQGWSCGQRQNCCHGVGGASYAGGGHGKCWGTSTYARHGCVGFVPGGGGSNGGACGGPCCYGGRGSAGLIIVSIDT